MQKLEYVLQRAVHCIEIRDIMFVTGLIQENPLREREMVIRHYSTTLHALGALGLTGYEIDVTLREAEAKWNGVRDQIMDIPWPYPSRLKSDDKKEVR